MLSCLHSHVAHVPAKKPHKSRARLQSQVLERHKEDNRLMWNEIDKLKYQANKTISV